MTTALRRVRAAAAAVLPVVAILGCGSSTQPLLPADAATQMRSHLAAVRSSATAGDRTKATQALDAFAADVTRQHDAERLSAAAYADLVRGISRARRRIAAEVAAPARAPVAVAPPVAAPPAAPAPGKGKGAGKAKGRKGRGR